MTEQPLPILQPLLSVRETAKQTGIPLSTLYLAVATGELRSHRFGKRIRLRAADVEAWINAHADVDTPAIIER